MAKKYMIVVHLRDGCKMREAYRLASVLRQFTVGVDAAHVVDDLDIAEEVRLAEERKWRDAFYDLWRSK